MNKTFFYCLSIFTLLSVHTVWPNECSILLPSQIYFINKADISSSETIFQSTNCADVVNEKASRLIFDRTGLVNNQYIKALLQDEFPDVSIKISPDYFEINPFLDFLNRSINLPNGHLFTDVNFIQEKKLQLLQEGEILRVECQDCTSVGRKNIKLIHLASNGSVLQSHWITASIKTKTTILISNESRTLLSPTLSPNDFSSSIIYSDQPTLFFSNINQLRFFKLNKPLTKGSALKTSDLVAIDLVQIGRPAHVYIYKNNLNLSATAFPTRSGKIHDNIPLKTNNNKILTGKVIDFNKVVVEL